MVQQKIAKENKSLQQSTNRNKPDVDSFCSFAKIVDKDGYVNVREKGSAGSKIIGTLKSGEDVFIFEDLGTDWLSISFISESKKELSGYIHRSRIKYINTLEPIPNVNYDDSHADFLFKDISVQIKTDLFDIDANKKYFSKDKDGFDKYKGKFMMGTDGFRADAKTKYRYIIATTGKQTVKIPQTEIEDLFNANNQYTACYYDKEDNSLYIHLSNSDGAGSYVVLFTIQNGIYKGRKVELPF